MKKAPVMFGIEVVILDDTFNEDAVKGGRNAEGLCSPMENRLFASMPAMDRCIKQARSEKPSQPWSAE